MPILPQPQGHSVISMLIGYGLYYSFINTPSTTTSKTVSYKIKSAFQVFTDGKEMVKNDKTPHTPGQIGVFGSPPPLDMGHFATPLSPGQNRLVAHPHPRTISGTALIAYRYNHLG